MVNKHQAGKHDQKTHGHDGDGAAALFSAEDKPVPRAQHRPLINKVLAHLGAQNVKVELIYGPNDPNYKALFKEMTDRGEPLPEFSPGKGPILDFGGGDKGVAYAIYDDTRGCVSTFDDMFAYGELEAASCLAHEVNHARMDKARKVNPTKYKQVMDLSKQPGKDLARTDGVTDYSRHYWKLLKEKQRGGNVSKDLDEVTPDNVVDETLAEIAKLSVSDPQAFAKVAPAWKSLYNDVKLDGAK